VSRRIVKKMWAFLRDLFCKIITFWHN